MQNPQVIRNYARALLANLGLETEKNEVLESLAAVIKFINKDESCARAFNSPVKDKNAKLTLLKLIVTEQKISQIVETFLSLLVRNNRLSLLASITKSLEKMLNEQKGIKNVTIISATTLSTKDRQYLTEQLAQQSGQIIKANFKQDQSLIGGLKIHYDSKLIDLSIVSALSKINQQTKNISLKEQLK